jgi:prolycopene isomerase
MQTAGSISSETYDIVVIGGGIGGLTASALLAKEGKKVLLLEQEDRPGGHARSFQRGAYCYDVAVNLIMGCAQTSPLGYGVIDNVLNHLGVRGRCEFVRVDPFFTAHFPDFRLQVPGQRDAYLQTLIQKFPSEAKGLVRLTDLCSRIYKEVTGFPLLPRMTDWLLAPIKQPRLIRYAGSTLSAVLDDHLSDPRLKALCGALWPYLGLPPSRASFIVWAVMMASYLEEGAFYCCGGFQRLADALAGSLQENGGEVALGQRVKSIRVKEQRVCGVELADGRFISSSVVVSNIDARQTFAELIPESERPRRYLRKIGGMKTSPLAAKVYLGTNLDIAAAGVTHENAVYRSWSMENSYLDMLSHRDPAIFVTIPSITDSSLAPPKEHVVILTTFIGPGAKPEMRDSLDDPVSRMLLDAGETVLPGLRNHITNIGGSSVIGPVYGWDATPLQSGSFRLGHKTPVSGLYLCGQWTQPGHGVWTVVLSGINTVRLILNKQTSAGMIHVGDSP